MRKVNFKDTIGAPVARPKTSSGKRQDDDFGDFDDDDLLPE